MACCQNPCCPPSCPPPPPRCCPDKCCPPCCPLPRITLCNPDPCSPCCKPMQPPMPCCPTARCLPKVCCPPPCCPDPCIKLCKRCCMPPPCNPPCCKKMVFVVSPPLCPPRCCPPQPCCPPCKPCRDPCLPSQYPPFCCGNICGRAKNYPDPCCPPPAMIVRPIKFECCPPKPRPEDHRDYCPEPECQSIKPYSIIMRPKDRCREQVHMPQDDSCREKRFDPSTLLNCGKPALTLRVTDPKFMESSPYNPDPSCCPAPCPPPSNPRPSCPISTNRPVPTFNNTSITVGCCQPKPKCKPKIACCPNLCCPKPSPKTCFVAVRPCPPLCCPSSRIATSACC